MCQEGRHAPRNGLRLMRLTVIGPRSAAVAIGLTVASWGERACADEADRTAVRDGATPTERGPLQPPPEAVRVGAIGGIGFPQPLAIEGIVVLGGLMGLGVEYE